MRPPSLFLILIVLVVVNAVTADPPPIASRIARQSVQSRALTSVGYSKRLHILEIEFTHGEVYRYVDVPRPLYRGLMSAESKARFYNANIKGKFRCLRVRPRAKNPSRN
jgi:hypothetical protein